ncbi:hypothetical protein H0E87_022300 [Populus deltoides]|uniref:DEAD-box RNA helicase Q domain-containing protein n=1 Tax=Populus deltoides TaxID=3696 RepID=A0A8T2XHG4_POPDE|nr:hypothetical protein H0E87_022300 [Populus deltoides]
MLCSRGPASWWRLASCVRQVVPVLDGVVAEKGEGVRWWPWIWYAAGDRNDALVMGGWNSGGGRGGEGMVVVEGGASPGGRKGGMDNIAAKKQDFREFEERLLLLRAMTCLDLIRLFHGANFPDYCPQVIAKLGFVEPTPIQSSRMADGSKG